MKVAPGGVSSELWGGVTELPPALHTHPGWTYLAVRRGGARLQVQHVGAEVEQSGCCLFHWLQGSTNLWLSLCEGVTWGADTEWTSRSFYRNPPDAFIYQGEQRRGGA